MTSVLMSFTGSRRRRFWTSIGVVILASFSFAVYHNLTTANTSSRVIALEKEVKCPSCIDLSIYNSNDATSYTMRVFIKKAVASGQSNSEILDTLVTTYGSQILMTPPKSGINLLLWFLPASFLVAAVLEILHLRGRVNRGWLRKADTTRPFQDLEVKSNFDSRSYVTGAPLLGWMTEMVRFLKSQGKRSLLLIGSLTFIAAGVGVFGYGLFSSSNRQGVSSVSLDQQVLDAEVLAGAGQYDGASQILSKVLQQDPTQPQALAYQGWISFQVGSLRKDVALQNKGLDLLKLSISVSPSYGMGHLFYGVALFDGKHDARASVTQFRLAMKDHVQRSVLLQVKTTIDAAFGREGIKPPL